MRPESVYSMVYRLLDDVTPLPADCGKLCGGACCEDNEAGTGMYLYPYEINMFTDEPDWCTLTATLDKYDDRGTLILLECDGTCERHRRPFACRIFPLAPYLNDGKLTIVVDPRAKGMCPLSTGIRLSDYRPEFLENVKKAARILYKFKECRAFMEYQSRLMDEWEEFQKTFKKQ